MCLLRPRGQVRKGELKHEYGILVHNMEDDSYKGTCFMHDGRYVTLSWQELNKAFKKVKENDYLISGINEQLLRESYEVVMTDVIALEKSIEASEYAYEQHNTTARLARDARRKVNHITIAGTPPDDSLTASDKFKKDKNENDVIQVDPVGKKFDPVEKELEKQVDPVENGVAHVQKEVDPVEKEVDPVEKQVDPVEKGVDPVEKKVDPVEKVVARVEKEVDPVGKHVDPVEKLVDPVEKLVEKEVYPVENGVARVEKEVDPVEKQVDPVEKQVDPVEKLVEKEVDPVENGVARIEKEVDPVLKQVDPLEKQVDPVEKEVDPVEKEVDPVEEQLDPVVKQVDPVEKEVDKEADPVENGVARVEKEVDPVEQQVDPVEKKVDPVEKEVEKDVDPVGNGVAHVEKDVDPVEKPVGPVEDVAATFGHEQDSTNARQKRKKRKKLSLRRKETIIDGVATQHEPTLTKGLGGTVSAVKIEVEEGVGKDKGTAPTDQENDTYETTEKIRLELATYFTIPKDTVTIDPAVDGKATHSKKRKKLSHRLKKGGEKRIKKQIETDTQASKEQLPPDGDPWADFRSPEGTTENVPDAAESWISEEWFWDEETWNWVYIGPKRIRRKDLTNKMERNWRLGMRRNWNTQKKEKMIAKITITRDNMSLVRTYKIPLGISHC